MSEVANHQSNMASNNSVSEGFPTFDELKHILTLTLLQRVLLDARGSSKMRKEQHCLEALLQSVQEENERRNGVHCVRMLTQDCALSYFLDLLKEADTGRIAIALPMLKRAVLLEFDVVMLKFKLEDGRLKDLKTSHLAKLLADALADKVAVGLIPVPKPVLPDLIKDAKYPEDELKEGVSEFLLYSADLLDLLADLAILGLLAKYLTMPAIRWSKQTRT